MDRRCLIIDDEGDTQSRFPLLKSKGRAKGFNVDCLFFNPVDECSNKDLVIDSEKVKTKIRKLIEENRIDLIACDYNLGDDSFSGLEMIDIVRQKDMTCVIILYSGNLNDIIKKILTEKSESEELKPTIKRLKKMVTNKISEISEREDFTDIIIHHLVDNIPLEHELIDVLTRYGDMVLEHGYTMFISKKCSEIAHEIRISSIHGKRFSKEIVERGITHMIALNE